MSTLYNKCDECKKEIKKFHLYKNKTLCGMCYRRHFTIMPGVPLEPFDCQVRFMISLTKSQKKILDKRIKYLFPKSNKNRARYLRALILGDIERWKKELKEEK